MGISENLQPFIYIRATGEKYPVTQEVHDAYYDDANRIRMEEQANKRCVCPQSKIWVCDGDCLICEYHLSGSLISLDTPIGKNAEDSFLNMVPSEAQSIESIVEDRDLLERLFAHLRELDPDADTIIAMWQDNYKVSDCDIAKALGRSQRIFANQMKKYRAEFRRIRNL